MGVRIDNLAPRAAPAPTACLPSRADPVVRRIAREWRRLTARRSLRRTPDADRRTLLGVSGGADSTAMLLALVAAAGRRSDAIAGVAHVLHDLRPPDEARADRDAVRALAGALSLPYHEQRITTADCPDNPEATARRARYRALAHLAAEAGCPFVATAHHADDQLESILMALLRGAGPDGLRGIAPRRRIQSAGLETGVTLIRPCLGITHEEAVDLCRRSGVVWREDGTNADTTRLRAALRHGPLADIALLRPGAPRRAARTARLMRDAAGLVHDRARDVFADDLTWHRDALRRERAIVLGAGLRAAALRLTEGRHADELTGRTVDPAIRAIRDDSTEPRRFNWPGAITLTVTAFSVSIVKDRAQESSPPDFRRTRGGRTYA